MELIVALGLNSPIKDGHEFKFEDIVFVLFELIVSFCAQIGDSSHAKIVRRMNDSNRSVFMSSFQ